MAVPVSWMHAFIDVPVDQLEQARAFWSAVTGWPAGPPWTGHPEFRTLEPGRGAGYLHLQAVDAPARVHLDLAGDLERDTERLVGLGAVPVRPGDGWQVLTSPGGLPFCVCHEPGPRRRPGPATWPGGHRSRLVQVCIDVPPPLHDAELAFWRAATGWADEPVRAPEFHRLVHRDQSPLQLLVQRLGDDGATSARAHLDLGTDDAAAEIERIQRLGARFLWPGDGFTALRDPAGLPFCVTTNDPDR